MPELKESVAAIRKWQRHHLLRQFGDNGHVLPENLELSQHIDRVIDAAQKSEILFHMHAPDACQHQWDGPTVQIESGETVTCSKCGMDAFSHSLATSA